MFYIVISIAIVIAILFGVVFSLKADKSCGDE